MQARGVLLEQIDVEDQIEIVQNRQTNANELREQQSGIAMQRLTKQLQNAHLAPADFLLRHLQQHRQSILPSAVPKQLLDKQLILDWKMAERLPQEIADGFVAWDRSKGIAIGSTPAPDSVAECR